MRAIFWNRLGSSPLAHFAVGQISCRCNSLPGLVSPDKAKRIISCCLFAGVWLVRPCYRNENGRIRNFSNRLRSFSADSSFFVAVLLFFNIKGVDPDVAACNMIHFSINTCIILRVNSFMREPVSLWVSSWSIWRIWPTVGCSGRGGGSTSGSTSSSLQSSCRLIFLHIIGLHLVIV